MGIGLSYLVLQLLLKLLGVQVHLVALVDLVLRAPHQCRVVR